MSRKSQNHSSSNITPRKTVFAHVYSSSQPVASGSNPRVQRKMADPPSSQIRNMPFGPEFSSPIEISTRSMPTPRPRKSMSVSHSSLGGSPFSRPYSHMTASNLTPRISLPAKAPRPSQLSFHILNDAFDAEEQKDNIMDKRGAMQAVARKSKPTSGTIPRRPFGVKSARKTEYISISSDSDSSSLSGSSDTDEPKVSTMQPAASPIHTPPGSDTESHSKPPLDFIDTFAQLSLSSILMEAKTGLPFLRRNLRRGFHIKCGKSGIPLARESLNSGKLSVEYRYQGSKSYSIDLSSWDCPICSVHCAFVNRQVLEKHLLWDHSETQVTWKSPLSIWLDIDINTNMSDQLAPSVAEMSIRQESTEETAIREISEQVSSRRISGPINMLIGDAYEELPLIPPSNNPLGPAARYPYLPAHPIYNDGQTVYRSYRPGGEPSLFDLLGTLSMEPFGIMAWLVLDREDEIFEIDEMPDEHKVIEALWARWIILNRKSFVTNFMKGLTMFIDQYWKMIHWAAGWSALQYFLMLFVANRYITGVQSNQLIHYYEGKTEMRKWLPNARH